MAVGQQCFTAFLTFWIFNSFSSYASYTNKNTFASLAEDRGI